MVVNEMHIPQKGLEIPEGLGGGGGGRVASKAKYFKKESMKLNWSFQWGGVWCVRCGYFWNCIMQFPILEVHMQTGDFSIT